MKKRLLCFALAILMLCSVFLTSCSDNRTDEQIIKDIVGNTAKVPLTFNIMIPTDANPSSPEFQERLAAVEEAINVRLRREMCAQIKIIAVNDGEYDTVLANKMNELKSKESNEGYRKPSSLVGDKNYPEYQTTAGRVENGTIQLIYPSVRDTQLDIILIRSKEDYVKYYSKGQLSSWKTDLTTSNYNQINKTIRSEVLDALKVKTGNSYEIYGIPNNHLYSNGEYKYMLINKSVASFVPNFDINSLTNDNGDVNYAELEKFINSVTTVSNTIPFSATLDDAPMTYWGNDDDFSLVGSGLNGGAPTDVLGNADYVTFMKLYKTYGEASVDSGKKIAVSYVDCDYTEIKDYENDYYVINTKVPVLSEEEIFDSVFAVTDYSIEYSRAKDIVYNLQTDAEIRTLLQYGIKGDDYEINDDGVLEMIKDNQGKYAYKMNSLYTGNGYLTYVDEGVSMDYWNDVKKVNYDSITDPYAGFDAYYNKLSKKGEYNTKISALNTLNDTVYDTIDDMTAEEFATFAAEWNNADTTDEEVLTIKNSAAYKEAMEVYTTVYTSYTTAKALPEDEPVEPGEPTE
ncbi:MAG: hypothetical protein IJX51_02515 [Clostridia bacterium]|nr:hypothetical protein [Clostridia bacterium]